MIIIETLKLQLTLSVGGVPSCEYVFWGFEGRFVCVCDAVLTTLLALKRLCIGYSVYLSREVKSAYKEGSSFLLLLRFAFAVVVVWIKFCPKTIGIRLCGSCHLYGHQFVFRVGTRCSMIVICRRSDGQDVFAIFCTYKRFVVRRCRFYLITRLDEISEQYTQLEIKRLTWLGTESRKWND